MARASKPAPASSAAVPCVPSEAKAEVQAEIDPKYPVYQNWGNICVILQQYEDAIEKYTRMIEIDPKRSNAYHNRSIAYRELGELEKAEADHLKAQELVYK